VPSPEPSQSTRPTLGGRSRGLGRLRWLLGLALLTACSWVRCAATGSPKIDENYPSETVGTLLLVALCLGWALAVSGWAAMLDDPPERPRRLFYLGLLATAGMLPLLSNDLFSLFAQASLSSHGQDIYASAASYRDSVWFSWIGERWQQSTSPYGPVTILAAWPSVLGAGNPFLAEAWLRLAWLVPLAVVFELSLRAFAGRWSFHTVLWLNPLLVVEGFGQLHPDLLGVVLLTAGLLASRRSPGIGGATGWALATLSKLNLGLTFPWFWLVRTGTWARRATRAGLLALCLLAAAALAYAPFWRGPETLAGQLRSLRSSTLVPGGTLVDVAGTVAGALAGPRLGAPVEQFDLRQQQARARAWRISQAVAAFLALAAVVPLTLGLLRRQDEEWLALATGAWVVAVFTLASPKFQSWYLLGALPFFALSCPPAWRRWWVWAVGISVTPEFALVLPRTALLYAPWAVTTLATVVVFLVGFRARFWSIAPRPPAVSS
jgi:hypothetical protein